MPLNSPIHRLALPLAVCVAAGAGLPHALGQDGPDPARGASDAPNGACRIILAQAPPGTVSAGERDDEAEIRIIQALEMPVSLDIENREIRPAIRELAGAAGIPIEIEPGTLDLLPYGSKTVVRSLKIEQQPLGKSLARLLQPIALTFTPEKNRLAIVPTKPLRRVVRRATWEELEMLEKLCREPWSHELFFSLRLRFEDAHPGDFEANRQQLLQLADRVGEGTAAEVLEHACDQYGSCWYPSGPFIVVVSKSRQVDRQLEKRVSVQYVQTSLGEALLDLTRRAGVLLTMDPGVLAKLPPQMTERFSLAIENATVRQALEVVAGQTGLGYAVEPNGLRLTAAHALPPPTTQGTGSGAAAALRGYRANPIVGEITVPNPNGPPFRFFIRENDLPPEVNDMRKARIRDVVNEMRRVLSAQQPQD